MVRCVRLFFVLLTLALVVGCSKGESPENEVFAVSDLAHKKVGVIKGTTAEAYAIRRSKIWWSPYFRGNWTQF